jgi:hypothetical protein
MRAMMTVLSATRSRRSIMFHPSATRAERAQRPQKFPILAPLTGAFIRKIGPPRYCKNKLHSRAKIPLSASIELAKERWLLDRRPAAFCFARQTRVRQGRGARGDRLPAVISMPHNLFEGPGVVGEAGAFLFEHRWPILPRHAAAHAPGLADRTLPQCEAADV